MLRKATVIVVLSVLLLISLSLTAAVKIKKDGKGYTVKTPAYTAGIDQTGSLQSLRIGKTEFIKPLTKYHWRGQDVAWPGLACAFTQGGGRPFALSAPLKILGLKGNELTVAGDKWQLTYIFEPSSIVFDLKGVINKGINKYSFFCINLSDDIVRACAPGRYGELPWPMLRLSFEGDISFMGPSGSGITAMKTRIPQRLRPEFPSMIGYRIGYSSPEKPMKKKFVLQLFSKPPLTHSMQMEIVSPNSDHYFPENTPIEFPIKLKALYGKTISGSVNIEGSRYGFKNPKIEIAKPISFSLTPKTPEKEVLLKLRISKPGHYIGKVVIKDDDKVVITKDLSFVASPEKIPPTKIPADFDKFWNQTLAELAKVPLDLETKEFPEMETKNAKLYKLKFRSWKGRWAWAWLNVPKKKTKVPATVVCPPVSIYQPGPARKADGRLLIKAAIHGGDIEQRKPEVDFDYMNTGIESRETYMMRYGYCCLVRCYDIIKNHPLCNGIVKVTGGSQGGGLAMVLGGLRPATEVRGSSNALCGMDWTVLGLTRWGPTCPKGADPKAVAKEVAYFEPGSFSHRYNPKTKVRLLFNLFDWCAPSEAIFRAINGLPRQVDVKAYSDPYGDHFNSSGTASKRFFGDGPAIEIPRWKGSAKDNKIAK